MHVRIQVNTRCAIIVCTPYNTPLDINIFPKPATIFISPVAVDCPSAINGSRPYGKFECATRPNVTPLWIINGASAAITKAKPGFENISSSLIPLPENHTLSLLYVPGSVETNNTNIICAAVVGNGVVAFSDPVALTVLCKEKNGESAVIDD